MSSEFQSLADDIYREGVLRARKTPPEQRLLDGLRLYEEALERMRIGIVMQHPGAAESEIDQLLRERIQQMWKLSDHGYYRPA
jgi:hypothetical protein